MRVADEVIIAAWDKTRSYVGAGKILGMHRNSVWYRLNKLVLQGAEIAPPLGKGKYPRKKASHGRDVKQV